MARRTLRVLAREHVGTIEPRGSVGALVLEAMRLEDEKSSAEPPSVASASFGPYPADQLSCPGLRESRGGRTIA